MKQLILISTLILTGCGSDTLGIKTQDPAPQPSVIPDSPKPPPCADSKLLGVWPVGTSTVIFNDDCSWSSNDCNESGTFTDSPDYTTFIALTSSCLPKLPFIQKCNYAFKLDQFYFFCMEIK